ncbi:hypothetical protein DFJ63DRAFT_290374 [Scheffersomyces coipomensis]|uniref:uncharacterized protein n=1 Tax=Scheffersomyces coipomensis TaxID=1788519 RepID=UPI00315DD71C
MSNSYSNSYEGLNSEINGFEGSGFSSVDDIFQKLTIPDIQKLNKDHKLKIESSKHDLHTLVGSKYRDLIKIAEDIDEMHKISYGTDGRISDLSYKPSKFLKLSTTNNFSKFDSLIRAKESSEVRKKNKITILRALIYNKLEKLDLKIATNKSSSPLIHSSNYIYYSKLYYTIETIFGDILQQNVHIRSKFNSLKFNFIKYLESELGHYNALEQSIYGSSSDKITPQQRLFFTDLINTHTILLDDDYTIFDQMLQDDTFEDDTEDGGDEFENEEAEFSKLDSFNKNSVPIINFLLAYTIVNRNNPELDTISKILENFADIRFKYLQSLLKPLVKYGPTKVNFMQIFRYIENSCIYIDKYLKDSNSSFFINLKLYTKSWDATKLIGFKDWIESNQVYFNQSVYLIDLPKSVTASLNDFNKSWIQLLFDFITNLTEGLNQDPFEKLSQSLMMFHNFIMDLSRLFDFATYNESSSKLIDLIVINNKDNIASKCFDIIISNLESSYALLFDELTSESDSSISKIVESKLSSHSSELNPHSVQLFSKDLSDVMDSKLEKYIDIMTDFSLSTSNDQVCELIQAWFTKFVKLDELSDYKQEISSNKLTAFNSLNSIFQLISRSSSDTKREIKWGSFSRNLFESEFEKLNKRIISDFWEKLNSFITKTSDLLDSSEEYEVLSNYYLLDILLTIKENIINLNHVRIEGDSIITQIDNISRDLFQNIVNELPTKFNDKFDTFFKTLLSNNEPVEDLPERPSMLFSALMYNFSRSFLYAGFEGHEYQFGKLFSNPHINSIFVDIKNKWLVKNLIEDKIYKTLKPLPTSPSSAENGSEEDTVQAEKTTPNKNEPSQSAYELFANIVFILQFTTAEPIKDIHNDSVRAALDNIHSHYGANTIDDISAKVIVTGVSEFYRSSKSIYLPLSI